jgi:hypothetical protein
MHIFFLKKIKIQEFCIGRGNRARAEEQLSAGYFQDIWTGDFRLTFGAGNFDLGALSRTGGLFDGELKNSTVPFHHEGKNCAPEIKSQNG